MTQIQTSTQPDADMAPLEFVSIERLGPHAVSQQFDRLTKQLEVAAPGDWPGMLLAAVEGQAHVWLISCASCTSAPTGVVVASEAPGAMDGGSRRLTVHALATRHPLADSAVHAVLATLIAFTHESGCEAIEFRPPLLVAAAKRHYPARAATTVLLNLSCGELPEFDVEEFDDAQRREVGDHGRSN